MAIDTTEPTGVALIMVDAAGENMICVASGANLALSPERIDAVVDDVFTTAGVLLASCEVPPETVIRAVERGRRHGLTTILNPAPAERRLATPEVLGSVDVLTPNEIELAQLLGDVHDTTAGGDDERLVARARRLCDLGCGAVVVTRGRRGCTIVNADGVTHVPAPAVEAIDTTAAGDAFNGALAVAIAESRPLEDACRWACAAAALSVTTHGAQPSLARRAAIDRFAGAQPR
ncbi:MAG: PfkB family carbohydrate kinase [Pirellulales bacterium]